MYRMRLRTVKSEDLDNLVEQTKMMISEVSSDHTDLYSLSLKKLSEEEITTYLKSFIDHKEKFGVMVFSKHEAAGFLTGEITETSFSETNIGRVGKIESIFVTPEYRKKKFASLMVRYAEKWFADRGITVVELSYLPSNSSAMGFWEKAGYSDFRIFSYKDISKEAESHQP